MRSDYVYDQFHSRFYYTFKNSVTSFKVKKKEIFFFTCSKILGLEVNKKNYSKFFKKLLVNIFKKKNLFKGYSGIGMNYFIGFKK